MDDKAMLEILSRRLSVLEESVSNMNINFATHIGSYDATQKAAEESRAVIRKTLKAMDVKMDSIGNVINSRLDCLTNAHNQQLGAIKFGKWLYGLIGLIAAASVWIASHITFMR